MKKKSYYSIVLVVVLFLASCQHISVKNLRWWEGEWVILESTKFPGEKGTVDNPLGTMIIHDDGFGYLKYNNIDGVFDLVSNDRTTGMFNYPLEIELYTLVPSLLNTYEGFSGRASAIGSKKRKLKLTWNYTMEEETWVIERKKE